MAELSEQQNLVAQAIWFSEGVPNMDKRTIARNIAPFLDVAVPEVEVFERVASDGTYEPTGPANAPTEEIVEGRAKYAEKQAAEREKEEEKQERAEKQESKQEKK